jgi:transposase-like protein
MEPRRKFTREFKLTAVRRLDSGQSVAEVARTLEVNPSAGQSLRSREHARIVSAVIERVVYSARTNELVVKVTWAKLRDSM